MNFVAVDTETTLFREAQYGYKTRITPFGYPDLVIGTFYDSGMGSPESEVLPRLRAIERLRYYLQSPGRPHLIFHNVAFDCFVFLKADPTLRPLFIEAVDDGRLHDTRIMEVLIQIARGSHAVNQKQLLLYPTLEKLAFKRAGMKLDKDPTVRLGFGDYLGKEHLIPEHFLKYACQDAEATYKVYISQRREAQIYASDNYASGPLLPGARAGDSRRPSDPGYAGGACWPDGCFGLLGESIQVKAALAFAWLEQFPVHVDLDHLGKLRARLETERDRFQKALVSYGWAKFGPKTKKFHFHQKLLRGILLTFARERNLPQPLTLTGLLSLKHDDWSPHLPKITKAIFENPFPPPGQEYRPPVRAKRKRKVSEKLSESEAPAPAPGDTPNSVLLPLVEERLSVWLRYMRVQKLLATYIWPYSSSPVHYPQYSIIGARSTRTSCRAPNIQNVSKRKDGIRSAFIPGEAAWAGASPGIEEQAAARPGQAARNGAEAAGSVAGPSTCLIEHDFDAAELRALAQVYHGLFGGSVLGSALNAGESPHDQTARWLASDYDSLPPLDKSRIRTAAKAVNFGLPGGLGARTLAKYARSAWSLTLTEEEARAAREATLSRDPQLRAYLAERHDDLALARLVARNCNCTWQHLLHSLSCWRGLPGTDLQPNFTLFRRRLMQWRNGAFEPKGLDLPVGFNVKFDLMKSHVRTPTGFVRGNCSYTQWHNTPFQELVASGAKLALWNLFKARNGSFRPVAFIHDSIVISARQASWEEADRILGDCMIRGMKEVCPNIEIKTASTGPLTRWGSDTNPWGEPAAEASSPASAPSPPPVPVG